MWKQIIVRVLVMPTLCNGSDIKIATWDLGVSFTQERAESCQLYKDNSRYLIRDNLLTTPVQERPHLVLLQNIDSILENSEPPMVDQVDTILDGMGFISILSPRAHSHKNMKINLVAFDSALFVLEGTQLQYLPEVGDTSERFSVLITCLKHKASKKYLWILNFSRAPLNSPYIQAVRSIISLKFPSEPIISTSLSADTPQTITCDKPFFYRERISA